MTNINTNTKTSKYERENAIYNDIISKGAKNVSALDQLILLKIAGPVFHKGGKIEGISSIDSGCSYNTFCQKMRDSNNPLCICHYCYDYAQEHSFKGLNVRNNHDLKRRIFSSIKFDTDILKSLMLTGIIRFNSSGDLENDLHAINYINIAIANPYAKFTLWAKNIKAVHAAIKECGKPDNLTLIYSNPIINDFNISIPAGFDYKFAVFTEKYIPVALDKGYSECNGQKCKNCGYKCYVNGHGSKLIAEKLRATKEFVDMIDKLTEKQQQGNQAAN